ncbi:hypothetical protein ACMGE7_04015 [Macrococcus equi]
MTDKYEDIKQAAEEAKENDNQQATDENNGGIEETKEDVQKTLE